MNFNEDVANSINGESNASRNTIIFYLNLCVDKTFEEQ